MVYSLIVILLVILIYGLVHSFLASLWAKARTGQWFGSSTVRWYRLAYNLFAVISLLPVLALPALLPDRPIYTIPSPYAVFFLAGQALAIVALLVGLLQTGVWSFLGLQQLVEPPKEETPELAIRGLYRWVRHPLYTAGLAFIWLTPVMTLNLLALNIGLTIYLVIGTIFEERKLRREFGAAYVEYQKNTPMLIPTFYRKANPSIESREKV